MNDDMPWVDLTPEEIQQLRTNKQQLTEYGKQKIRELMNDGKLRFYEKGKETLTIHGSSLGKVQTPKTQLHIKEMTHEEMLEEAAKREAINKEALESIGIDYENFGQKPWDESMLEEAAKREAIVAKVSEEDYQKVQEEVARQKEEQVLKIAIDFIEEHSEALEELRKIEHKELIEELEAKKKENFQLVADACMKEYEQKYRRDVFPVDEYWVYMIGEYFGTGEGQTTCIMMTQANPGHKEDFENSTNKYVPCTTKQYRAVRAFHEQFGTWMLHGLKFLSREDFFTECAYYIPPVMMKLSNKSCFKDFYTRVHYNFS